jgi:hypothetical protein
LFVVRAAFAGRSITENDPGVTWWYGADDMLAKAAVADVQIKMPCCGATVPFTSLKFDWPAGFAYVGLVIWNPDIGRKLSAEEMGRFESILGCELSQIWAHY